VPLDGRKLEVLRAIVEDYVATHEPVGSKSLVERHQLQVSPATIRNDMAFLEDEGYIRQPHTSAGRVPTDRGYRLFVDRLGRIKPLSSAERRAIQRFLEGAVDLDDVVHRTVKLLAQLTRQVAVVQYPSLSRSAVRHLELVPLHQTRLMLVMITDTGRVEQRLVELSEAVSEDDVVSLRNVINEKLVGCRLTDTPAAIESLLDEVRRELRSPMRSLSAVLLEVIHAPRGIDGPDYLSPRLEGTPRLDQVADRSRFILEYIDDPEAAERSDVVRLSSPGWIERGLVQHDKIASL